MNRAMINADEGDSDFEEDDPSKQYIYMELESTQGALADMDVDAMFNSNSVDEFMKGIANKGTFAKGENISKGKRAEDAMSMIGSIMQGKRLGEDGKEASEAPKLDFGGEMMQEASRMNNEEELRNRAMQNLKERRLRLKSSAIFNAKKEAIQTIEAKVASQKGDSDMSSQEEEEYEAYGREKIDLTIEQTQSAEGEGDGIEDMDDFDLLEATIDPTDVKSMERRNQLEKEIAYEEIFIKSKLLFRMAMSESNPLKIDE